MCPNIPGIIGYIQPQVVSRIRTLTKAVSIPGGLRVLSINGEGRREEVVIDSAAGDGTDGFNPDFSTPSDGYGRYFRLSYYPDVPNRTDLYLNGAPLRILEDIIDNVAFSSDYDARFDPDTGEIEMQSASLVDLGGAYFTASTSNVGDGYLSGVLLVDENAPAETWTIRCINALLDGSGAPIRNQASFTATGSVSGSIKDAYGQPYIWKSDGLTVSNGIISFAVLNPSPRTILRKGDRFTVQVQSKVLQKNDQLTAKYIAEADLNDPETFTDPNQLFVKHGSPNTDNTLSLGAQLAFANGATSVLAIQAKPPLPRRTSEIVLPVRNTTTGTTGASGNSDEEDLIFAITAPGKPDIGTSVHFFLLNTDGTEEQIFPNKVDFYDPDITTYFSAYEKNPASTLLWDNFMNPGTSGYTYSYTVVGDLKVEQAGTDGYIVIIGGGSTCAFTSPSITFTSDCVGKQIDIHNTSTVNLGRYSIDSIISSTTAVLTRGSGSFINETSLEWQLLPADAAGADTSQRILFTSDLALARYKGLRVSYIDTRDSDFFDPNWADVLDTLEAQDAQILVPLPSQTVSAIQQAYKVHADKMSSPYYKKERLLFTGALQGLTTDNVLGVSLAAAEDVGILEGIQGDSVEEVLNGNIEDLADYSVATNFGDSFRVMYYYPDEIIAIVNGESTTLPGYYIAAAAGGWFAGEPNIAMPITMKTLVGFTISNSKIFKQDVLNKLGNAGIVVCQPIVGAARVLHGKTTTQSGYAEEEEASIVFIRDQLGKTMRQVMLAFVGQPEDKTLLPSLTAKALGVLNSFVSQNLITAYRNLSVKRDPVEPRQWNVSMEVQPNMPVNWIFIDISVGLF